jgi:putative AlgH/UPF0301 family transcriptional regulator
VGTPLAHTDTLYRGGPVNARALVLLHDNTWYSSNTMQIGEHLAISSDTVMLEKLSEGNTPAHSRLIAGLSGWAPGQLLAEIQGLAPYSAGRSQWLVAGTVGSLDTIFGTDGVAQWHAWIDVAARRCVEEYF